jgi:hypothetical protein
MYGRQAVCFYRVDYYVLVSGGGRSFGCCYIEASDRDRALQVARSMLEDAGLSYFQLDTFNGS